MPKKRPEPPRIEPREFRSVDEIDSGISKLERRIRELETLDVAEAERHDTGAIQVVRSNIRETIRDVFGTNSPEFDDHEHIDIWAGPMYMGMPERKIIVR